MKALVVLLVIALGIWLWQRGRRREVPPPAAPKPRVGAPQAMLRCAHCGLHLPSADAVAGQRGAYCSTAHLQAAEQPH